MRSILFLGLTGCLSGVQATGQGDLLITEYGEFSASFDQSGYVEIGNPTANTVALSDYTIALPEDRDFSASVPLTGSLGPGQTLVIEFGGGDFQEIFGRAPDMQLPTTSELGFTPDEVILYLADGSGLDGASMTRGDATFQDVLVGDDTSNDSLRYAHLCRRPSVPRGRGRFDESEWVLTDTFSMDADEAQAIANPGELGCP